MLASALWLPLVTSRSLECGGKVEFLIRLSGIQLLLIKVLAACESFGGSLGGTAELLAQPLKGFSRTLKRLQSLLKLTSDKQIL